MTLRRPASDDLSGLGEVTSRLAEVLPRANRLSDLSMLFAQKGPALPLLPPTAGQAHRQSPDSRSCRGRGGRSIPPVCDQFLQTDRVPEGTIHLRSVVGQRFLVTLDVALLVGGVAVKAPQQMFNAGDSPERVIEVDRCVVCFFPPQIQIGCGVSEGTPSCQYVNPRNDPRTWRDWS